MSALPAWAPYQPRREPRIEKIPMRSGRIALTHWGPGNAPPIVLLHGMLDCGASYQFVVDCLPDDWDFVAVDWRGYGHSDDRPDLYWFPDNLADLEALLDRLTPGQPARVMGHSLGATVAMTYAGIRPERFAWLINMEGFGVDPRMGHAPAPDRVRYWLDEMRALAKPKRYGSLLELAERVARHHPRLRQDRAQYLAWAWSRPIDGGYEIAADPKHRLTQPVRLAAKEIDECWGRIKCPVLLAMGAQSEFLSYAGGDETLRRWRTLLPQLQSATIADAGHMLLHEQPERVADEIVRFVHAHTGL
jgi:pimeloyl-ACP methyl ester carboxylesterase